MKGVSYVTDESNKKLAVQIDIKLLEKFDDDMEDLIDGIIAESRKKEVRKPLNEVIKQLKKKGKLK
jgi:NAD(P)H-hydrate repair Nnr-like enzyme with NAD(P)H-hydrate epimerase domain